MGNIKVIYVNHMGSDKDVVNSARGSFGKFVPNTDELTDLDKSLIRMLARGMDEATYQKFIMDVVSCRDPKQAAELLWSFRKTPTHEAPFGHCFLSVYVEAPIFVRAHAVKHEYLRMSEVSRRYVRGDVEFYDFETLRKVDKNIKQGSSTEEVDHVQAVYHEYYAHMDDSKDLYYSLMRDYDLCPEQARSVLPQSMMTRWKWSGSLDAFANMYNLRSDSHAQEEIRLGLAKPIGEIARKYFPYSWDALTKGV